MSKQLLPFILPFKNMAQTESYCHSSHPKSNSLMQIVFFKLPLIQRLQEIRYFGMYN